MPIYNYKCKECDTISKYFNTEEIICACGCKDMERLRSIPLSILIMFALLGDGL